MSQQLHNVNSNTQRKIRSKDGCIHKASGLNWPKVSHKVDATYTLHYLAAERECPVETPLSRHGIHLML